MNLEQIDTSTTAGKAEVMRLAAEGRRVATRALESKRWYETSAPCWSWNEDEYAIIAALTPPEGCVELSHVEDILLQAETLARSGGADAEAVVEWISECLIAARPEVP